MYRRASSDGLAHHKRTVRSQSPEPFSLQEVMIKLSLTSPAAIGGALTTPERPTRPQASDGDGDQWRERANQVKQMTQLHHLLRQWFELPSVEQHARGKILKEQQFGFELLCSKMQRARYDIIKSSRSNFVAQRMAIIRKTVNSPRRAAQTARTPQKPPLQQLSDGSTTPRGRISNKRTDSSPDDSYFAADSPQASNHWQSLRSSSSFTAPSPPGEATMVPLGRQYRKSLTGGEQLLSS